MQRRSFLHSLAAGLGLGAVSQSATAGQEFEITLTQAQWRERLSPQAYRVLREHDTERPFSSPLNTEKRAGLYHCAGCDLPLYDAAHKYDSGTGWPSFWKAIDGAIGTQKDRSLFMVRTECHCRRCGGHLGHIFGDGPKPTGKRHCLNGVALTFRPA